MKVIQRITAIAAIVALVVIGCCAATYIAVDNSDSLTRLMMHDLYSQDQIDILVLGASHAFTGIDPEIVGEELGKNVFIAGSSNQKPDASLALLREALDRYPVEHVYFEVSNSIAAEDVDHKKRTKMIDTYIVSDYMKPSLNKLRFLLGASTSDYYPTTFLPARREQEELLDFSHIAETIRRKRSPEYNQYSDDFRDEGSRRYVGKGYCPNATQMNDSLYWGTFSDRLNVGRISAGWKNAVLEIISECKRRGVKLTLFCVPISNLALTSLDEYDAYIAYIHEMIEGLDVEFCDFNLIDPDVLAYSYSDYYNNDHLSRQGAEKFSRVFAQYASGKLPKEAFYPTVKARLEAEPADFYGAYIGTEQYWFGDYGYVGLRPVFNKPEEIDFRIEVVSREGEVLDYDEEAGLVYIPLAADGSIVRGSYTITWSRREEPGNATTVGNNY